MRILGTTSSNYSTNYAALLSPSAQPTTAIGTSATTVSGFASGNGYYVKYGGNTTAAANGYIEYSTSLSAASWTSQLVQSEGQARGINYVDTGAAKYWIYGNDTTGKFFYTTDGTPFGTKSNVTPLATGATGASFLTYFPGAARPWVAVGGAATGIFVMTATTINGTYTASTFTNQSGSVSVQGLAIGGTGTGSDKRLIFVCGGNGANATYFSAVNSAESLTLQTISIGDCRGLAYTGTHWLYLGDNSLGRAAASAFNNTTGNVITNPSPAVYPGTVRGLAASPTGNGVCYLSGGTTIGYSTDHGATWAAVTSATSLSSNVKMSMSADTIVAYSNAAAPIAYLNY